MEKSVPDWSMEITHPLSIRKVQIKQDNSNVIVSTNFQHCKLGIHEFGHLIATSTSYRPLYARAPPKRKGQPMLPGKFSREKTNGGSAQRFDYSDKNLDFW